MVTIETLLAGGFGLVRRHPRAVAIWTVLYLALLVPMMLVVQPFMTAFASMQATQLAGGPPSFDAFPTDLLGPLALLYLGLLLVLLAIFAAAVRAVTGRGSEAFGFLRLGMDEVRLTGLTILLIVGFIVAEIVVVAVMAVAIAAIGSLGSKAVAAAIGVITFLAIFPTLIWLQVRLSLVAALTVMRGKIIIGESWRITRGHFWTLFTTYLLLGLGYIVFTTVVIALTNPALFSAYTGGFQPAAMGAAMQAQSAELASLSPLVILRYVLTTVFSVLVFAVVFGTAATAARELSRDRLEDVF